MAFTILNVGVGHFILAFVWVICVTACILVTRIGEKGKSIGPAFIILAGVITVVMWVIPRESINEPKVVDHKIYDETVIGRTTCITLLALVLLVAIGLFVVDHIMMPIYAKPLKKLR